MNKDAQSCGEHVTLIGFVSPLRAHQLGKPYEIKSRQAFRQFFLTCRVFYGYMLSEIQNWGGVIPLHFWFQAMF